MDYFWNIGSMCKCVQILLEQVWTDLWHFQWVLQIQNRTSRSQGSKFSDLSLISDFFPTPRTILEICVNLKRNFFWRGGGRVIGIQWPKMALECTTCDARSQKIKNVHTPQSTALHAFILFCRNPFWSLEVYFLAIQSWYVHGNSPKFSHLTGLGVNCLPKVSSTMTPHESFKPL